MQQNIRMRDKMDAGHKDAGKNDTGKGQKDEKNGGQNGCRKEGCRQCFGSIFIESGSGSNQKSESGSADPVPDPSYFLTLSEIFFLQNFIITRFSHKKSQVGLL